MNLVARRTTIKRSLWKEDQTKKAELEKVAQKLGIKKQEDWYGIRITDLKQKSLSGLLRYYNDSISQLLSSLFPQFEWVSWKFVHSPHGHWDSVRRQRLFLDSFAEEMNLEVTEDWYNVTARQLLQKGGSRLLALYGNSISLTLSSVYPEYDWHMWKFHATTAEFWRNPSNCRKYFDWLSEQLDIRSKEDWYKIGTEDIPHRGAPGLLLQFNHSFSKALMSSFPEEEWQEWKFKQVPPRFWQNPRNQRKFLDSVAKELNIEDFSDWYNVGLKEVKARGGLTLLAMYGHSLTKALTTLYPENQWHDWKFRKVSKGHWDHLENQKKYIDWLQSKLEIQHKDEWSSVPVACIHTTAGSAILHTAGGLLPLLRAHFPGHSMTNRTKTQRLLFKMLSSHFDSSSHQTF